MKWNRALRSTIVTGALALACLGVCSGTANAAEPLNYGGCVSGSIGIQPSSSDSGPLNEQSRTLADRDTGALNATAQSGGNSRFPNAIGCA
jgi:hypothetical protein